MAIVMENSVKMTSGKMSYRDYLAYATVPIQQADTIYNYATALAAGTLFPGLDIPQGQYGPKEFLFKPQMYNVR